MKSFCNAFAVLMAALCTASTAAALPLVWRADWPDAKPVETLVHRGTDVELQPQWFINKEPADTNGWTFTTFCQTNAVGPWFGPLPGAFFSHTNDVGAAFYNVMVRASAPGGAVNYTAFARLRMLDSPGFAPGELPLPVPFIDFSKVVALHAPWTLQTDFSAATNTLSATIGGLAQNLATNYYTAAETEEKIVELAPMPGDYAAVSNAAMNALSRNGGTVTLSNGSFAVGYDDYGRDAGFVPCIAVDATGADPIITIGDDYVGHGGAGETYFRNPVRFGDYATVDFEYGYTTIGDRGQHEVYVNGRPRYVDYALVTDIAPAISNAVPVWALAATKPTYTAAEVGAYSTNETMYVDYIGDIGYMYGDYAPSGVWDFGDGCIRIAGNYQFNLHMPDGRQAEGIEIFDIGDPTVKTVIPIGSTLAQISDISAAISPTSPAFSNAVISVGIGIDTNTVAVINELVDSSHDLPVSGATSVGALLLALAAAVAALKGNKADKPTNPTNGNLVKVSGTGELQDAGYHFEVRNGIPCIVQYT